MSKDFKKIKHYCSYCGKKCVIREELHHYDSKTGKPICSYWATCPDYVRSLFGFTHINNEFAGGYRNEYTT